MIALIFVFACAAAIAAYFTYGRLLERWFGMDRDRPTPAHGPDADGVDLAPAPTPVLFGHHFSSIAGAGPIVGPIIAAQLFGWGPALAWILVGAIFVGGVHDFGSLALSIRHGARSIAEVCRLYLSPLTYRAFLLFIWLTLVYVLVVFVDLTAAGFMAAPAEDPHQGGVVASASLLFILAAAGLGLLLRRWSASLGPLAIVAIAIVALVLVVAYAAPVDASDLPGVLGAHAKSTWIVLLLAYCFVAAITPVWLLLQPRDFLASFLLYACLGAGGIGMLLASATGAAPVELAFFKGWSDADGSVLFPVLFITVACGACSGFHSVVSSGTTAKQLRCESAARPVAYGAMLVEAVLAVFALGAVMVATGAAGAPTVTFSQGVGRFLSVFGIPPSVGAAFGLLAVSTFLLTTLDTCTRLGRYLFEEFFDLCGKTWRPLATLFTLVPVGILALTPFSGADGAPISAWRLLWPAFGTTNQLMAGLALLVIVVWRRSEAKSIWFVAAPMMFMLATTSTSMVQLVRQHLLGGGRSLFVGVPVALMLGLTLLVIGDTARCWGRLGRPSAPAAPQPAAA